MFFWLLGLVGSAFTAMFMFSVKFAMPA